MELLLGNFHIREENQNNSSMSKLYEEKDSKMQAMNRRLVGFHNVPRFALAVTPSDSQQAVKYVCQLECETRTKRNW